METEQILDLQFKLANFDDKDAYKALFLEFFPKLQNFAFAILKDRSLAEELSSDLFILMWLQRKEITNIKSLKTYLYTSIKNNAIKKLKSINPQINFSLDNLQVEFISDYCSPSELSELNEMIEIVSKAVNELPPKCKIVYKLAKEDKLKYKEISELLGISVKTIDNHISKALQHIQKSLDQHHIYQTKA